MESVGLVGRVQTVGTRISEAGDTMKEVLVFFGLALVFFLIAYLIGLPTLLIRPAKFTISFTMGSFMTIAALATFRGPSQFFSTIFQPERVVKTVLYIVSLVLSILCSVVWKSYIGTVFASLFQMVMLVLFVLESFPAGSRMTSLLLLTIRKAVSMFFSMISRFFR